MNYAIIKPISIAGLVCIRHLASGTARTEKAAESCAVLFLKESKKSMAESMRDDFLARFILLVLFQAQSDRATELVIAPNVAEGSPIRYKVGDAWYEMSPPPSHLLPGMVAELGRLAAFRDRAFPKEGAIDLVFSGVRLRWKIRMASGKAACILTPIQA
jgi:hypothetical protein